MADILGFIKKALPWIGAAASGNVPALVAMAAKTVGDALGTKVDADAGAIGAAIAGATPDQIAALRKADQEFALKMQELGFANEQAVEKIAADDRASARDREKSVRDKVPAALATIITIGFFSVLGFMLFRPVPEAGRDALMIMLGSLGTAWTGVVAYYFGSSAGSAEKTKLLAAKGKE